MWKLIDITWLSSSITIRRSIGKNKIETLCPEHAMDLDKQGMLIIVFGM